MSDKSCIGCPLGRDNYGNCCKYGSDKGVK